MTVWITAETQAPGLDTIMKRHFETPGPFYGMLLDLDKASVRQVMP